MTIYVKSWAVRGFGLHRIVTDEGRTSYAFGLLEVYRDETGGSSGWSVWGVSLSVQR